MTTGRGGQSGERDDSRDVDELRDPRIDAAWRNASNEEPPVALDAAIRAQARREVGAGPQREGSRAKLAARRRWWPLVAAATLAAMTAGLLQLVPPEELGAPPVDRTVTDMPRSSPAAPSPAAKPEASRVEAAKPEPSRVEAAKPEPSRVEAAKPKVAQAPAAASAKPQTRSENAQKAAASKLERDRPSPEPFPAAPAGSNWAAPPTEGPVSAPTPPPAPPGAAFAPSPQRSVAPAAKDRGPLPVDEWIALIRRLLSEGRTDEAAKELEAFRAAHADHAQLLPRDLRDWRPPIK